MYFCYEIIVASLVSATSHVVHSKETDLENNGSNNSEIGGFKKEEIDWLTSFLASLDNPSDLCSFTCSGKLLDSHALSVLEDCFSSAWIINSSAIDHLKNSFQRFSSYNFQQVSVLSHDYPILLSINAKTLMNYTFS